MIRTLVLTAVLVVSGALVGCQGKTPEEVEAAKYPKAKPLTPAELEQAKKLSQLPSPSDSK